MANETITILNYGMGNIGAIPNMLKKFDVKSHITDKIEDVEAAEKIILPGVGSFGRAMRNLSELGFIDVLNKKVLKEKTPVLGICLGMQLLANASEESPDAKGFGWIPGQIKKFNFKEAEKKLKVPHMGWNHILKNDPKSALLKSLDNARFYFVHSYYYDAEDESHAIAKTNYSHEFTSIVQKDNIFGVQFHPEKSHRFGLQLLKNFSEV